MDFRALIYDFIYCRGDLQKYINRRFQSKEQAVITYKYYDHIVTKAGIKINITQDFNTIEDVMGEYQTDDLDRSFISVDVGANIGGFTMIASQRCDHVFSVEPVRVKEIVDNLALNNIRNVTLFDKALGDGSPIDIGWGGTINTVQTVTFSEIVSQITSMYPDKKRFLKCDCEGGEKFIPIDLLATFDRIEMELHGWEKEVAARITTGLKATHDVVVDHVGSYGSIGILHAVKK